MRRVRATLCSSAFHPVNRSIDQENRKGDWIEAQVSATLGMPPDAVALHLTASCATRHVNPHTVSVLEVEIRVDGTVAQTTFRSSRGDPAFTTIYRNPLLRGLASPPSACYSSKLEKNQGTTVMGMTITFHSSFLRAHAVPLSSCPPHQYQCSAFRAANTDRPCLTHRTAICDTRPHLMGPTRQYRLLAVHRGDTLAVPL